MQGATMKVEKYFLTDDRNLELTIEKHMNHHNKRDIVEAGRGLF